MRRKLCRDQTQLNQSVAPSKRQRALDKDCKAENDQLMELIYVESNFNFLKMHLITHFRYHIYQFGNILMYLTEFGELAYKQQIKDGWRHYNKIDAAQQILNS